MGNQYYSLGGKGYKNLSPFIKLKMPNHQRVYIGGIPTDARDRDLEKFFKGYGRGDEVVIKNGYGFVEFDDYRDADDAVSDLTERICKGVEFALNLQETQGTVAENEVVALDEEVVTEDVEILQDPKLTIDW